MLLEIIEQVRQRLTVLRRYEAACYVALCALSAVVAGLTGAYFQAMLYGILVALSIAVGGALALLRKGVFRSAAMREAALALDQLLTTKDRVVTYLELVEPGMRTKAEVLERSAKSQLIAAQCMLLIAGFDPRQRLQFVWSARMRWCVGAAVIMLIVAALLFARLPRLIFESPQAQTVAQLIEQHPELPQSVKESLRDVARELDKEAAGDAAARVNEAIERAQAEVAQSKSELAALEARGSSSGAKEIQQEPSVSSQQASSDRIQNSQAISMPTATPSSTPVPEEAGQKPADSMSSQAQQQGSAEQQNSSEQSGGNGGAAHEKPKEGQSGEGAKQEQGNQGGAGSDQGQQQQQQTQNTGDGSGQGQQQGKESKQDQGSSRGQGGGTGGGQGSSEGQGSSAAKQGSPGKQGSDGSQPGEGSDGQQGDGGQLGQQNQAQGQSAGSSGQSQGLDAAQQKLQQLNQERSKDGKQGSQSGATGQGQSGPGKEGQPQGGKKKADSNTSSGGEGGDGSQNASSQGSQGSAKSGNAPGERSGQGQSASKGQDSSQKDPGQSPADQKSGESGAAKGGGGSQAKRFDEGKGTWPGLGEQKAFKEAEIAAQESSFDPRYTGQETTIDKNTEQAKFRVGLPDAALAKPDTVKEGEEQPIPLEYKDLLK